MKRLIPLLACAALLLLPSCVEWRIGRKIRESADTTTTALQLGTPADGCLYASRKSVPGEVEKEFPFTYHKGRKDTTYYARMPVVKHGYSSSVILWHLPHSIGYTSVPMVGKATDTPRLIALRDEKLYLLPEHAELPEDAEKIHAQDRSIAESASRIPLASECEDLRRYGSTRLYPLSTSRGKGKLLVTIAAAPFDYLIDPALTVLSTCVVGTIGGTGLGVMWIGNLLRAPFHQDAIRPHSEDASPTGTAPSSTPPPTDKEQQEAA